jgi:hypothetical protein
VLAAARDSSRAPSIPDVLAEHLEEFGFLSLQRRKLLFSEECTARQLVRHDRRIDAHWAGLCVAPEDSVTLAKARLEDPLSPWEVMDCVRTWIELGKPSQDEILEALAGVDEIAAPGWREAFRRIPAKIASMRLPQPAGENFDAAQEIVLDAFSWHMLLPEHRAWAAAASSSDPARLSIARHAREPKLLEQLARDAHEHVRRAARWSLLLLNPANELERMRTRDRSAADPFESLASSLLEEPPHAVAEEENEIPREPGLASLWRRAVLRGEDPHGMRREIPDGFFTGELADEAIAGE